MISPLLGGNESRQAKSFRRAMGCCCRDEERGNCLLARDNASLNLLRQFHSLTQQLGRISIGARLGVDAQNRLGA